MARRDSDVLSALLDRALSLPPEGRAAFLANECRNDQSLREEISSLLAAHDASCVFFERLSEEIVNPALLALSDHVGHELVVGQMLAQYRILERLAAGGMGVVFKAFDQRLDRFVALKFLPAPLSGDPRAKERLVAEAKAASALDHPNIAVVHDIGETDRGLLFIVMGYYEGETLERKNERGPLPARDALDVVKQIAHALSAAHRKGIVHRDVKPSNVLVTKEGTAKLLDFGIAKLTAVTPTREAAVPGTVAYMSPEQTRGSAIDHRTDLWSLGVMLYEMLIGVRPFRAENDEALVRAIRHDEWQLLDSMTGALPAGIVRVLERCLAKDPDRRYRDAPELLADLRMLEAKQSSESNRAADGTGRARLLRYGGIAALVSVVTAGVFHFERRFDDAESPQRTAESSSHRNRLAILPLVHVRYRPGGGRSGRWDGRRAHHTTLQNR